jgi:phosphoserine aminotransferase
LRAPGQAGVRAAPGAAKAPGRGINFSAAQGPLPAAVKERLAASVTSHPDGLACIEEPFTGERFRAMLHGLESDLRKLLAVPDSHRVLFAPGGATAQFAAIPLNLCGAGQEAHYVDTGYWSRKASREAARFCSVRTATHRPGEPLDLALAGARDMAGTSPAYCHVVSNETADGWCWPELPDGGGVPLVVDASSDLLARVLDVGRCGLVYASSQKNLGVPGFALVVIRNDLLREPVPHTPLMLRYEELARAASLVNTPATASLWIAAWMSRWILEQGGIEAMARINARKAARIYGVIDHSEGFYRCLVEDPCRSHVNICMRLAEPEREGRFLERAEAEGLSYLRGHPQVGGIRISLYNGHSEEAAEVLAQFLEDFARREG